MSLLNLEIYSVPISPFSSVSHHKNLSKQQDYLIFLFICKSSGLPHHYENILRFLIIIFAIKQKAIKGIASIQI